MRVMFIDDDPIALARLEARLDSMRSRWTMSFVCGAEQAVDRLSEQPVDVVVAESRMQKMSGIDLLARVRGTQPQAIRMIVSGPSETDSLFRQPTLAVVHQVLPKPCDHEVMCSLIERAVAQRKVLSNDAVRSAVTGIDGLPTMPALYATLTSMLADPRVSLDSIAALVEGDTAITARVLQTVNSAYFSRKRGIDTVREAITLMGVDIVRVLVLTTEMFGLFDRGRTSQHFALVDLASHGLMVARKASKAAEADPATKHLAGVAFSASILRDVGQVVMATALPDMYETAFLYARTKSIPFHHAERLLLRFTHAEIGAYLLALWGLPEPIVDAVAHHHFPAQAPQANQALVHLIHAAEARISA